MTARSELARDVEAMVDRRRNAYVAFLTGLFRFETVSGATDPDRREAFREEICRSFDYLEIESERLGLDFRRYTDLAAVAEWPCHDSDLPPLGLATHIDVVPSGKRWQLPPFGGTVAEKSAWGRGAQDDKGAAAAVFSSVDVLKQLQVQNRRPVRLLFGTREETEDWPDIDRLIAAGEVPPETIVPDGVFPVVNAEKGRISMRWDARWPEPAPGPDGLRLLSLTAGKRANMVPARALLQIAVARGSEQDVRHHLADATRSLEKTSPSIKLQVRTREGGASGMIHEVALLGKAAHGALPDEGRNGALAALEFWTLAQAQDTPLIRFVRLLLDSCREVDGSGLDLVSYRHPFGGTTVNLGIVDIGPSGGSATIDVRFPQGLTGSDVASRFAAVARAACGDDADWTIETHVDGRIQEPLHVDPEEHPEFISGLQQAYQIITGRTPDLRAIAGTTYAKAFPMAVAFGPVDEQGGEVELAHEADERVTLERHLENIRIYAMALAILACGR